jgi:hypothetical protein
MGTLGTEHTATVVVQLSIRKFWTWVRPFKNGPLNVKHKKTCHDADTPATTRTRCAICWHCNNTHPLCHMLALQQTANTDYGSCTNVWRVSMHAMGTIPNISAALRLNAVYLKTFKNGGRDRTIHVISVIEFLFNSRESVEY